MYGLLGKASSEESWRWERRKGRGRKGRREWRAGERGKRSRIGQQRKGRSRKADKWEKGKDRTE